MHGPIGHVAGLAKRQRQSLKRSSLSNHEGHCSHQPSAPELVMPVEPLPKRHKVDDRNGPKRKRVQNGPAKRLNRRKVCDADAIAAITRLREARAQDSDLRVGNDLIL